MVYPFSFVFHNIFHSIINSWDGEPTLISKANVHYSPFGMNTTTTKFLEYFLVVVVFQHKS